MEGTLRKQEWQQKEGKLGCRPSDSLSQPHGSSLKIFLVILTQGHFFIAFLERGRERKTSVQEKSIDYLPPVGTVTRD